MADLVLATFTAKYIHPSLGLRCLRANLGPLRSRSELVEFDLAVDPLDAAEALLARRPRVVALGAHVWNVDLVRRTTELISLMAPGVHLVTGGPELDGTNPDAAGPSRVAVVGEADLSLPGLVEGLLAGEEPERLVASPLPDPAHLALPYDEYSDDDLRLRLTYVETTRGCPGHCTFCCSAASPGVRPFPLDPVLAALDRLMVRGARRLKFVDRSFDADEDRAVAVLDHLAPRLGGDATVHLELRPRLPGEALRRRLSSFPPGQLHLEVGVQSLDDEVARGVGRPQAREEILPALDFFLRGTGADVHLDLVVGLPGDDLARLRRSVDGLLTLRPGALQINMLKILPGTSLRRSAPRLGLVHAPRAPYQILSTPGFDRETLTRLRHVARLVEILHNRGGFAETFPLLLRGAPSPLDALLRLADWFHRRLGRTHAVALTTLVATLRDYLADELGLPEDTVRETLARDYGRAPNRKALRSLRDPAGP